MANLTQLALAWQTLLTSTANRLAVQTGFTQRVSTLNGAAFVQSLIFGWLDQADAALNQLASLTALAGADVSAQALAQRFSSKSAALLGQLLQQALQIVVNFDQAELRGVLARFKGVYVLDSSSVMLPDSLAQVWPGCGGRVAKNNLAALKLNLLVEISQGVWQGLSWMAGRTQDRASDLAHYHLPKGALRLADLGYFSLKALAQYTQQCYWLSRVRYGTVIYDSKGVKHQLEQLLKKATRRSGATQLDLAVELGVEWRLAARLVAVRLPKAVAMLRRSRLKAEFKREGKPWSSARSYLCEWTVYATNVPLALASVDELLKLGRARWQVELIFKWWKSEGLVDESRSEQPWRVLSEVYAKLIGIVLSHGVMLVSGVGDLEHSQAKAYGIIRGYGLALALQSGELDGMVKTLGLLARSLARHCGRDKRGKADNIANLLASYT